MNVKIRRVMMNPDPSLGEIITTIIVVGFWCVIFVSGVLAITCKWREHPACTGEKDD